MLRSVVSLENSKKIDGQLNSHLRSLRIFLACLCSLQAPSIRSRDARRLSGIYDQKSSGDDNFLRRSSWNGDMIKAAAMADQLPPSVVDSVVEAKPSGDDLFIRRSSWNQEQIKTQRWSTIQPPPIVEPYDLVPSPSPTYGDSFFLRRSSYNADQIKAESYATIPAPSVQESVDWNISIRRKTWNAQEINACLPSDSYVATVSKTIPNRQTVAVVGAC